MKKQALAMLLALVLVIGLISIAGCGDSTATPSSQAPAAEQPSTQDDAQPSEQPSEQTTDTSGSGDVIKIGTPTYLTGSGGFTGNETVYGIKLAIAQKETLWGKEIQYIPADGVDNSKMPSAAEYLLNVENVQLFIMGSNNVPGAMQAAIQPKGGFQMETSNWTPSVLDAGYENHIQNPLMYDVFAREAIDILLDEVSVSIGKDRDTVRIGVMCVSFWQPIADVISDYLKEINIEPVFFEVYPDDIADFTALIAKMKAAEVDILFHTARPPDVALFLKQSYTQKYRPTVVAGNGLAYDQPEFAEIGEAGAGVLNFSWPSPSMNEEKLPMLKKFKEEYKAFNNRDPLTHSMAGYVGATIALEAFEQAGEADNAKIKEAFMNLDIEPYTNPNLWGFKLVQEDGKSAYNAEANILLMSQWFMVDGTLTMQAVRPDDVAVAEAVIPYPWFG